MSIPYNPAVSTTAIDKRREIHRKMEDLERKSIEEKIKIEKQFQSGAGWFYWIAGLSLVNSAILLSGSQLGFIIGLGITQIIDAFGLAIAEEIGVAGKIIAFVFDVFAAGIFVLFGVFAKKKYKWAFIVGMILYALDGLIFLLVKDFLSIGFHIFALLCIYSGFKAIKKLKEIEEREIVETQPTEVPTQ